MTCWLHDPPHSRCESLVRCSEIQIWAQPPTLHITARLLLLSEGRAGKIYVSLPPGLLAQPSGWYQYRTLSPVRIITSYHRVELELEVWELVCQRCFSHLRTLDVIITMLSSHLVSEHEQGLPPTTQRLLVMPGLPLIIDIEFPALISIRGTDQDHTQHTLALPIGI